MAKTTGRVALTLRLDPEDKEFFAEQAERCGLEPSVAIRQIIELYCQRMRDGGDFIDALHELKSAWKDQRKAA